jgi:hypothetical protein
VSRTSHEFSPPMSHHPRSSCWKTQWPDSLCPAMSSSGL